MDKPEITIGKEFSRSVFYPGTIVYRGKEYGFTLGHSHDHNTDSFVTVVSWTDDVPKNETELEKMIIDKFSGGIFS